MSKPEVEEEGIEKEVQLTLNLRRAVLSHGDKIAPKAVRLVRNTIKRHMHADDVLITPELNELLWSLGKKKTLRKVRLRVVKTSEGVIKVYPAEASK